MSDVQLGNYELCKHELRLLPSQLMCVRPKADSTKHEQNKGLLTQ
jgi:hypothetical protein